ETALVGGAAAAEEIAAGKQRQERERAEEGGTHGRLSGEAPGIGEGARSGYRTRPSPNTSAIFGAARRMPPAATRAAGRSRMTVQVRIFSSNARAMGDICAEAAEFAGSVGQERLINISHTKEGTPIWGAVWSWEGAPPLERHVPDHALERRGRRGPPPARRRRAARRARRALRALCRLLAAALRLRPPPGRAPRRGRRPGAGLLRAPAREG